MTAPTLADEAWTTDVRVAVFAMLDHADRCGVDYAPTRRGEDGVIAFRFSSEAAFFDVSFDGTASPPAVARETCRQIDRLIGVNKPNHDDQPARGVTP